MVGGERAQAARRPQARIDGREHPHSLIVREDVVFDRDREDLVRP
jgi:hypothetical protein